MPDYADAKHRPHAIHTGEAPTTEVTRGPESLVVMLDNWPNADANMFPSLYDALQANWGESPSRTVDHDCQWTPEPNVSPAYAKILHDNDWGHSYGWCKLTADEQAYVEACFAGKTLQQVLERFMFCFAVDGCTRAETHQIVRTRVGAGFMQHGGRDNDWRHRNWTMPETIARMCDLWDLHSTDGATPADSYSTGMEPKDKDLREVFVQGRELKSAITNWDAIRKLAEDNDGDGYDHGPRATIDRYLAEGKRIYAALVDAGIPWQDARRVLWMGTQTYIHCDYNYVALKGVLGNRLEFVMDWEVNCVAQLMLREVKMKCPPIFARHLGSHSDIARGARFAGLESWPPDGKWPSPYTRCVVCGAVGADECQREPNNRAKHEGYGDNGFVPYHSYQPADTLPRQHTAEQMPFWVLAPESMNGAPVRWIPTNGTYPHDLAPVK